MEKHQEKQLEKHPEKHQEKHDVTLFNKNKNKKKKINRVREADVLADCGKLKPAKADSKSTLAPIYWPLMQGPTMIAGRCFICGRRWPLEQHHYVWRSWGKLYRNGIEVRKPTITLCGRGNNLKDPDGRPYCHGLAHDHRLHFRFIGPTDMTRKHDMKRETAWGGGRLQYLITEEPTDYMDALDMEGWRNIQLIEGSEKPY